MVGETEWVEASLTYEDGSSVTSMDPIENLEEAFFNIPGLGEYEFKALSVTDTIMGPSYGSVDSIITGIVEYDNMGMEYAHSLSISESTSVHGFN